MDNRDITEGERESEGIRRMAGICGIIEKAREAGLRYYGHVRRREEDQPVREVMDMAVRGRRSAGRQRIRWRDVVRRDMEALNLRDDDALDRGEWRKKTRAADPTIVWE